MLCKGCALLCAVVRSCALLCAAVRCCAQLCAGFSMTAAYYLHFQHFPCYPESPITQSRTNMAERLTVTCVHLWPTLNPNQGRIEDLKPGLFILMPVMGGLGQACRIICQKASFKTVGLVVIILLLGRTTTTCSQYMTVLQPASM